MKGNGSIFNMLSSSRMGGLRLKVLKFNMYCNFLFYLIINVQSSIN